MNDLDTLAEKAKRTRQARRSKRKGSRGELAVQQLAVSHGFDDCRRNFGSGSRGGNDLIGIPGVAAEVKFQESLNIHKAYAQCCAAARATETPVVFHKRSRGPLLATLDAGELMALMALRAFAPGGDAA